MQNKLFSWLIGSVKIELTGDCVERFFNLCRSQGIYIWNIICHDEDKKTDYKKYICEIYASELREIIELLRKTNTKMSIKKKFGFPFFISKIKDRLVFLIGFICCMIMLNIVTNYIWAIQYCGNESISSEQISDFLYAEGIGYGIKKSSINCDLEEKKLRDSFDNIIWTSIYFEGTKLVIEIKENNKYVSNNIVNNTENIVSNDKGTITYIVTRNGIPKVKKGDVVEKGQILVDGRVPIYDEENSIIDYHNYCADADIILQQNVEFENNVLKKHENKCYIGKKIKINAVEILGYNIEFYSIYDLYSNIISKANSIIHKEKTNDRNDMFEEKITVKHQMVLLDKIYLPLYYREIYRQQFYVKQYEYTMGEMKDIITDNYKKLILCLSEKGVQIVEKNVKIEQDKMGLVLHADLVINKPINVDLCEYGIKEAD